jgi:transcription elongation factor Elf1
MTPKQYNQEECYKEIRKLIAYPITDFDCPNCKSRFSVELNFMDFVFDGEHCTPLNCGTCGMISYHPVPLAVGGGTAKKRLEYFINKYKEIEEAEAKKHETKRKDMDIKLSTLEKEIIDHGTTLGTIQLTLAKILNRLEGIEGRLGEREERRDVWIGVNPCLHQQEEPGFYD